jgi:ATP-dependent exoDNAse (exonuclease V) beta subunit
MAKLTANRLEIRPELPFVLHEGNQLIDGTIDLLCRTPDGFTLFDYKFTEAPDAAIISAYQGQMKIYQRAAQHIFPEGGTSSIILIVISAQDIRQVPIRF